ncbi:MAG: glycosyltransferase family 39 protein [Victivallales bacterium]|nr:glycosyltransferase family 39 protein [Victivallales bacterium]
MFWNNANSENKKIIFLFALTILFSMLINTFHPYLWGPDEPRVAEIAREAFVSGNYVTPHLCGRPFVEKPPLHFDMIALAYVLTGDATAEVARLVSVLLGCVMLGVAFWIGYCWGGLRRAVLAVSLLIIMPQFYRTAHFIVTDISVGAFCSLALGLFMYYVYWPKVENAKWILCLFYLASAAAFLTKGLVGIFHIGIVIATFILLRKRWDLLKRMLSPPAMLVFLIPVGVWIYLFYCEGGLYFLHEHFINNTIGRFFHIQFKITGSQLAFTDIGNDSPWYFYLKRMPVMFSGVIVLLPFIFWDGLRKLNILPHKWVLYSEDFKKNNKGWKAIIFGFLLQLFNGRKNEKIGDKQKDIVLILFLWAFLPIFLLSFSSIKEVTYILPSYVAIAIMSAVWLDERLSLNDKISHDILCFALIVIPVGIASFTLAPISVSVYILSVCVWMSACLLFAIISAIKLCLTRTTFIICAILLCLVIMLNTPEVMRTTNLNRKCHFDLAKNVFDEVGDNPLYIFGGCETLRGSIPFYGRRSIPVILSSERFKKVLSSGKNNFIIIVDNCLNRINKDREIALILSHCKIQTLSHGNLCENYILISAPDDAIYYGK